MQIWVLNVFFVPSIAHRLFFSLPLSQVLKRIVMSLLTKVRYSTVTYSQSRVTTLDSWLRVFLCGFAMASAQIAITHLADGPPFHLVSRVEIWSIIWAWPILYAGRSV